MSSRHIIIAGDAPVDLFLYPPPAGLDPDAALQTSRTHWLRGGASLLADLLKVVEDSASKVCIHKPDAASSKDGPITSIIELETHSTANNSHDSSTFKLKRKQQLNAQPRWHRPASLPSGGGSNDLSILILQDAEGSFDDSDSEKAIELLTKSQPRILLCHLVRPLCAGKIWEDARHGPYVDTSNRDPEQVIVMVSADDLRAEGIELSYGLSWERTCEDFVEQLGSVGRLVTLVTCAHLIVLFGCDGVIYHRGRQAARPTLFFDPLCGEGEFFRKNLGYIPGVAEAFVAGFAKSLVQSDNFDNLEESIEFGLWAARRLARCGLSIQGPESSRVPGYDVVKIMKSLGDDETGKLIRFSIPSDEIGRGSERNWSLLDHIIGDPAEVARRIVEEGTHSSTNQVPLARFNRLVLFDRQEIESFRTLFNFLLEYLAVPNNKPLSIALFGPRGSGKAFAALQVAESASKGKKVRQLRFDLAQFTHLNDLLAAFHSVRDCVLEGFIPLVYFNSFDTSLSGSQFGWLPYLLAPMLAGKFSDRGVSRPIGPAVFFFGANVVKNYEELQRRAERDTGKLTRMRDFLSCLHGFVNMLGPDRVNHGDGVDRLYPVRRAVILRALLEAREPNLKTGEKMNIDESVLNGLLLVPNYRQGITSLKAIIDMSRLNGHRHFERAALPPHTQLGLHVDCTTFTKYMNGLPLPESIREELAEKLHNVYLKEVTKISTPEEIKKLKQWSQLDEELRESSRAHADSIPHKLRLISCFLAEKQDYRKPVAKFTPKEIDFLGEVEHDRWNVERLQKQWGMGERAPEKRKSPFLIPWDDLERKWQDIDRFMVASYPSILPEPYVIYRMGPKETDIKGMSRKDKI